MAYSLIHPANDTMNNVKQTKELGINVQYFGNIIFSDKEIINSSGEAVNNIIEDNIDVTTNYQYKFTRKYIKRLEIKMH